MSLTRALIAFVIALIVWGGARDVFAHPVVVSPLGDSAISFAVPEGSPEATSVIVEFMPDTDPFSWTPGENEWTPIDSTDAPWLAWNRCYEIEASLMDDGWIRLRLEGPGGISGPSNPLPVPEPPLIFAVLPGVFAVTVLAAVKDR